MSCKKTCATFKFLFVVFVRDARIYYKFLNKKIKLLLAMCDTRFRVENLNLMAHLTIVREFKPDSPPLDC